MDAWAVAVVGIAGIIGAFIGPWFVQRNLERRREKRAFRRAARLVAHESGKNTVAADTLAGMIEEAKDNPPPLDREEFLWTEHWESEGGVLAASLPDADWLPVHYAYGLVRGTRGHYQACLGLFREDALTEEYRSSLITDLRRTRDAFDNAETLLLAAEPLED